MQLVDVKLGAEGEAKITLSSGVVQIEVDENTSGMQGGIQVKIPLTYFLDALAAKANNQIVTGIVKVLDGVLVSMP